MTYAQALYSLSVEQNVSVEIYEQIHSVKDAFLDNPEFSKILDRPCFNQNERDELIDRCLKDVNVFLLNCIKIMSKKRVSSHFVEMADEFIKLYQRENGIETVTVITAVPLTTKQVDNLKIKLEKILNKKVLLTQTVDGKIMGGIIVRTENAQFDSSVKTRLEDMSKQLKSSVM